MFLRCQVLILFACYVFFASAVRLIDESQDPPLILANLSEGLQAGYDLQTCTDDGKAPPDKVMEPAPDVAEVKSKMKYVLWRKTLSRGNTRYAFVEETPQRKRLCLGLFPTSKEGYTTARNMTSSDQRTFAESVGVCLLVEMDDVTFEQEYAMLYSEYNTVRNIPNFVTSKVIKHIGERVSSEDCRAKWKTVCPNSQAGFAATGESLEDHCNGLVDADFTPDGLIDHFTCQFDQPTCTLAVATRGHMLPVKHMSWSRNLCAATMTYVNVFPSRQPFDGAQWSDRENLIGTYINGLGRGGFLWVTVGVSKESDGAILSERRLSKRDQPKRVEVPSFVWTAIYDPQKKKATGWLCRNGLTAEDDCNCMDMLSIRELESKVGYLIFPDIDPTKVDLEDGRHDEFWANLHEKYWKLATSAAKAAKKWRRHSTY